MRVRGRYLIVGWTAIFLAAAGTIVRRDLSGFALSRQLDLTTVRITTLEGIRSDYQRDIAMLGSRAVLGPKVQSLGLHFPSDSAVIQLHVRARP